MANNEDASRVSTQRAVPLPIASGDLELDKTGSGWVLTAWPAAVAPAVLRLCIHEYLNVGDPFLLVLEVRFQHCKDFTRIVVLDMTGDELLTVSGREDGWPTVPAWLQPAFPDHGSNPWSSPATNGTGWDATRAVPRGALHIQRLFLFRRSRRPTEEQPVKDFGETSSQQ